MKLDKQRIIDIVITALVGASIAFLQSLLSGLLGLGIPHTSPEIAGTVAGLFKGLRELKSYLS